MKIENTLLIIPLYFSVFCNSCEKKIDDELQSSSAFKISTEEAILPTHALVEEFLQQHILTKSKGVLTYSASEKTDGKSKNDSEYTMYVTVDCMATEGCAMNTRFEAMKWEDTPKSFSSPNPMTFPNRLKMGQHISIKFAINLEKREGGWTVLDMNMIR